ncbi:hypothetical protein GCM10027614_80570 [Micromonospora vulcania]
MAGVSQATVSLVLNNRTDTDVRIAPETRDRVLRVIAETGYAADPVARRLASRFNRIIGVFTYEPAFPSGSRDFFHPFLLGIEEYAERVGCDLLLFTSAPVVDGRRGIFHQDNRLRLADGCILLGREIDGAELHRLNRDGYPYVAVGRRDDAGGPVPYVGADYAAAVARLVQVALRRGHRRLTYVATGTTANPPRTGSVASAPPPRPRRAPSRSQRWPGRPTPSSTPCWPTGPRPPSWRTSPPRSRWSRPPADAA